MAFVTGGHKRNNCHNTIDWLVVGVSLLIVYTTVLELIYARHQFHIA